jgi:TRAP-type uncharacterized transport system substrate-binding protein
MTLKTVIFAGLLLLQGAAQPVLAKTQTAPRPAKASPSAAQQKAEANAWTVGLAGGLLEGTFIRYAADLAKVLDDGDNLRVIPMVTFGAVGNVSDLLNLKGVDFAITQSDVLDHFRRELKVPNIENRIQYISPLYLAEVHVYARAEIKSLRDLEGRKVAFNTPGSAANLTGQVVFQRLGIRVEPLLINNSVALEKMRSGEIAAVVHVVGKPNDLFAKYKPEPGFHFLPVEYDSNFEDYYVPATLTREDYPALIPSGETISTIAVPTVLAVYNWPKESERYPRVVRFIEAYFSKFTQLQQSPFQPKWQDVNLAGKVPGWTRYPVAEEALAKLSSRVQQGQGQDQLRSTFDAFVASNVRTGDARSMTPDERDALFSKFLEWQRSR